jgi:hypothetical protein
MLPVEQTAGFEPGDPFECGVFDRFTAAPWPATVDDLGLEKAKEGARPEFAGALSAPVLASA